MTKDQISTVISRYSVFVLKKFDQEHKKQPKAIVQNLFRGSANHEEHFQSWNISSVVLSLTLT